MFGSAYVLFSSDLELYKFVLYSSEPYGYENKSDRSHIDTAPYGPKNVL